MSPQLGGQTVCPKVTLVLFYCEQNLDVLRMQNVKVCLAVTYRILRRNYEAV